MVECNIEFARLEISRVGSCSRWIDLQIFRFEFRNEVKEGASQVREKSIILFLNRISKDIVFLQKVTVVNVESSEFIFAHRVNLLDVDKFAIGCVRKTTIRSRGRRKSHFLCKTAISTFSHV